MMDLDLSGKTALVTGSTAGIGRAIAAGLARQGATVWVNGRTQARVDASIAAIRKDQPSAKLQGIAADGETADGAAAVFAALPEVDVLVNNLGGIAGVMKPFGELTDADWDRIWQLNVVSAVRFTRKYLPGMRTRDWGRVLFVSSESGIQIPPEFVHYGAAKAAMIALARGVAETCTGCNVTVNSLLPGPTFAEGTSKRFAASGQTMDEFSRTMFRDRRPTSLLKRFATVDEVANMAVYLCSPASAATHGASVRVDGGVVKSAF
jgi:NAD(P)-dependent dehydrogenase (short-subunit alcohol dehydrogenase family)